MQYRFLPQARNDLKSIRYYTMHHYGASQSKYYKRRIIDVIVTITDNPYSGREVQGLENIRRFEVEKHVIFYQVDDGGVIIIRILHQAVDFLQVLK